MDAPFTRSSPPPCNPPVDRDGARDARGGDRTRRHHAYYFFFATFFAVFFTVFFAAFFAGFFTAFFTAFLANGLLLSVTSRESTHTDIVVQVAR